MVFKKKYQITRQMRVQYMFLNMTGKAVEKLEFLFSKKDSIAHTDKYIEIMQPFGCWIENKYF